MFIDDMHARNLLEEKKPDITESSLSTYLTCYRGFCKMFDRKIKDCEQWLTETDKIFKYINTSKSISTRKTRLSAFVVLARISEVNQDTIDILSNEMKKLIGKYNEQIIEQKFTDKESENWVNAEQLDETVQNIYKKLKSMGYYIGISNVQLEKEFQKLVLFILCVKYPVRNEWGNIKVTDEYDGTDDGQNYLLIKNKKRHRYFIYLNAYKTKKKYGQLVVQITNKEVIKLLKTYLEKYQRGDYLFNSNYKQKNLPLGSSGVTQSLNKISVELLGKRISTGMIRKSLISRELEGQDSIREKNKKTKEMINKYQHSGLIHDIYRKIT